jgi:hypothetical protein
LLVRPHSSHCVSSLLSLTLRRTGCGSLYVAQFGRFLGGVEGPHELARPSAANKVMLASVLAWVLLPWLDNQSYLPSLWPEVLQPIEDAFIAYLDVLLIVANALFLLATVLVSPDIDPIAPWVAPLWALAFPASATAVPRALVAPVGSVAERGAEVAAIAASRPAAPSPVRPPAAATSPASPTSVTQTRSGRAVAPRRRS